MNRREFLKSGAVACAVGAAAAAPSDNGPLVEFAYANVTLTGGPLKRQYDMVHRHFLSLDNDRLLKVYRQRAGIPAPGDDMGGWYDADGFVPGHTLGQYISGLSRIYSTTKDPACAGKVSALVLPPPWAKTGIRSRVKRQRSRGRATSSISTKPDCSTQRSLPETGPRANCWWK